ncbi:hypothetical protein ACFFOO_14820 [Mucilaginibacter ginsenosidivorans]|uniref:Uncharacterized protein n=1 Tax=Mucilaginibacter ginsenosidivorans TaxID=398053 RepID=A0A5B8USV4_9SPHI|nr:hypothetical protein FRZ54_06140 [Mucilaginibacter ginsenosidivorans]
MKQGFIIFFCLALGLTCIGQSKVTSYTLSLEFTPSLSRGSTLMIHKTPDSSFVELRVYKGFNKKELSSYDTARLNAFDLVRLTGFLQSYHYSRTVKNKREKSNKYPLLKDLQIDGIEVDVNFNKIGNIKKYHFSNHLESEDRRLMSILFDLMQKAFPMDKPFGYQAYEYINELKTYF